ncbi:MAG: hypothetical protein IPH11_04325 [Ignavibacteriales bacterium]|nr:hypothetical protein [Ignavibacteriales bacterium]
MFQEYFFFSSCSSSEKAASLLTRISAPTYGIKIVPLATPEEIRSNVGILGIKRKSLLKALMEEKKIEREL